MKFEIVIQNVIKNKFFCNSNVSLENCEKIKVCTDTRNIEKDEWFLPLAGNNFDGHDFINDVRDKCIGVICSKEFDSFSENDDQNRIIVKDTTEFFQEAGRLAIDSFKKDGGVVIGITGSNGKTTNKEYLYMVLNGLFPGKVYATQGNLNNHLGVPFCCLSIEERHDYAILEMGTNHFGEIEVLANIAKPDIGFITNIGDAHLEFLKNREGVLSEKRALYDFVVKNSQKDFKFLLNGSDVLLNTLPTMDGVKNSKGLIKVEMNHIILKHDDIPKKIKNDRIFGKVNLQNLGFISLFLIYLFPELETEVLELACKVEPPDNNRSTWINWKNKKVFLDAYNANPSSMEASLESFIDYCLSTNSNCGKVLFILGEMKELGEQSSSKHRELGRYVSKFFEEYKDSDAIFVGEFADDFKAGMGSYVDFVKTFARVEDIKPSLLDNVKTIFVKGSRSTRLETLFS